MHLCNILQKKRKEQPSLFLDSNHFDLEERDGFECVQPKINFTKELGAVYFSRHENATASWWGF